MPLANPFMVVGTFSRGKNEIDTLHRLNDREPSYMFLVFFCESAEGSIIYYLDEQMINLAE